MDVNTMKVGNIYKFTYKEYDDRVKEVVAGVLSVDERNTMVLKLDSGIREIRNRNILNITSTRIAQDVRKVMKDVCKVWSKKSEEEARHCDMLSKLNAQLDNGYSLLMKTSGSMSSQQFGYRLHEIFAKQGMDDVLVSGWREDGKTIKVSEDKYITKYASPEMYSFIYREYDGSCFVKNEDEKAKKFAKENAPAERTNLRRLSSAVEVDLSLGDKDWLCASRIYTIKLTNGYTEKSLEDIEKKL